MTFTHNQRMVFRTATSVVIAIPISLLAGYITSKDRFQLILTTIATFLTFILGIITANYFLADISRVNNKLNFVSAQLQTKGMLIVNNPHYKE